MPIYIEVPFISRMQQTQTLQNWIDLLPKHRLVILNLVLTGLNPNYLANDPSDRVFGLFGLLRAFGVALPVPDYRKKLSEILLEIFTEIAVQYDNSRVTLLRNR